MEALAHEIIGTDADPGMQSVAHRIAEPQIDLGRIRLARQRLLSSLLTSLAQQADPLAEGPQKFASILSEISKQPRWIATNGERYRDGTAQFAPTMLNGC